MSRLVTRLIARLLAPFAVRCGHATHYAHTREDAIDWMRQYPAGFGPVFVINRRTDSVVAIRTTKEV
jgi:hypothetical protein